MVDTNVFSGLVNGRLHLGDLPTGGQFWATPVQLEELKDTRDEYKKAELLSVFKEMIVDQGTQVLVEFSFNIKGAGWGEAEWGTSGNFWRELKEELDAVWVKLPLRRRKSSKKENNPKDALIAVAAKVHGFTLLTCDCGLAKVAAKYGIKVRLLQLREQEWLKAKTLSSSPKEKSPSSCKGSLGEG